MAQLQLGINPITDKHDLVTLNRDQCHLPMNSFQDGDQCFHVKYEGAVNVFHVHDVDQVLYVTAGEGIIATETEEIKIGNWLSRRCVMDGQ